jgi:hypothetical protein
MYTMRFVNTGDVVKRFWTLFDAYDYMHEKNLWLVDITNNREILVKKAFYTYENVIRGNR